MPNWTNPDIEWDAGNIDHIIERHDIYPEEAEQVFRNGAYIRHEAGGYRAYGQSDSGQYLFVACLLRGNRVRVISARPMRAKERRLYGRHR
ncbi:MAG: BrnT family toxin [Thermomicrobiales bacterium]